MDEQTRVAGLKAQIDVMSHEDLCRRWRFSKGDPLFQGEAGDHFATVLKAKGGFTPEISKQIGWGDR